MVIERTPSEIIIRLPADVDTGGLQRLLDYLTHQEAMATPRKRLKELLLTGPALTDEQLQTTRQTRKAINQWRTKS